MDNLTIQKLNFKEFKEEYLQATNQNKEMFLFQKFEVRTSYAKYVIEYMEKELTKGQT